MLKRVIGLATPPFFISYLLRSQPSYIWLPWCALGSVILLAWGGVWAHCAWTCFRDRFEFRTVKKIVAALDREGLTEESTAFLIIYHKLLERKIRKLAECVTLSPSMQARINKTLNGN
jgi:hypothetical protein